MENYVGERIKEIREANQLSQAELARLISKSVETISNFERGKTAPSLQTLHELAETLGVRVRDFFDDTPIKGPRNPLDASVGHKWKLLAKKDKELVLGMMDMLIARKPTR